MSKLIPLLFLTAGIFTLVQVGLPLLSFRYLELAYAKAELPLTSPQSSGKVLGISIQNTNDNFPLITSNNYRAVKPVYQSFNLDVPSIGISNEVVEVDSNDLSVGLIQLPGSAMPGEKGNLFISGHSMLPQIFVKGEKAVFAKLTSIKKGDEIITSAMGTKFRYKVVNIKIVKPEDISVISPPDSIGRYITLMTCVPPGLNTKRLIVLGKLI